MRRGRPCSASTGSAGQRLDAVPATATQAGHQGCCDRGGKPTSGVSRAPCGASTQRIGGASPSGVADVCAAARLACAGGNGAGDAAQVCVPPCLAVPSLSIHRRRNVPLTLPVLCAFTCADCSSATVLEHVACVHMWCSAPASVHSCARQAIAVAMLHPDPTSTARRPSQHLVHSRPARVFTTPRAHPRTHPRPRRPRLRRRAVSRCRRTSHPPPHSSPQAPRPVCHRVARRTLGQVVRRPVPTTLRLPSAALGLLRYLSRAPSRR